MDGGTIGALLAISGLIFLSCINLVLQRLSAMLPDETLRLETKYFTTINRGLLLAAAALAIIYHAMDRFHLMPLEATLVLEQLEWQGRWLIIFKFLPLAIFVLLPLAMTMALLWKIKETLLNSVSTRSIGRREVGRLQSLRLPFQPAAKARSYAQGPVAVF